MLSLATIQEREKKKTIDTSLWCSVGTRNRTNKDDNNNI